ncbi:M48 family metallopeptidase [Nonomuraea typhae]|uniref:M48 family metallopeptidase n=1 Tax=Nonomuraea typhae TaxID=2603600 RepID=UPI0012F718E3|nr:M48 family metallopeptidase [Nonomuraea typhae]
MTLLVGFYLLVAALVVGTIFLDVYAISTFRLPGLEFATLATFATAALLRALLIVHRVQGVEPPSVPVLPEEQPALWREVEELAARVRSPLPDEIRLFAEPTAAVAIETRLSGLRVVGRTLFIGLPLVQALDAAELRAVLAHELAHTSAAHSRLTTAAYRGRVWLVAAVDGLDSHPYLQPVFSGYARMYLRLTQAISRRQEYEADALAVALAGRAATASALRKTRETGAAWDLYAECYLSLSGAGDLRPAEVFAGFRALLADPVRQAEVAGLVAEPEETSPYDSHPSWAERQAAIAALPDPGTDPDPRPARALLPDPPVRALERALWRGTRWSPLPWEDLVEKGMYATRNAEALRDLAAAGQRVMGTARPYVDAAFEAIARGRQDELAGQLRDLGWKPSPTLLGGVLGQALEALLIEHGQARWTLSWSGPARLLYTGGEEVEVDGYAAQVAAEPSAIPGLRAWLDRMGVERDYVPA